MINFNQIKFNFLLKIFKKKRKLLWTLNYLLNARSVSAPYTSVLYLNEETSLGKKGERIFVTNDSYQTWYIINSKEFNKNFVDNIKKNIQPNKNYNLIDIGANTGLVSRSFLKSINNITDIYCVEPDEENFYCLEKNLEFFSKKNLYNFALDILEGKKNLYIDKVNKGNLSFYSEQIKRDEDKLSYLNDDKSFTEVNCKRIEEFFLLIDNKNTNIIKIDVQGYDEVIFQEIPDQVLNNTDMVIIEITPLKTKEFDKEKFDKKMSHFSKYIDLDGNKLTKEDILKTSLKKNGKNKDFIFLK